MRIRFYITPLMRLALGLVLFLFLASAVSLKKESARKPAPDFALRNVDGQITRLSDYRGKVVLVDFWATWCGPCKAETPWLVELSQRYQAQGLVVLGVSMDEDWSVVKSFVAKTGITYPILLNNQSFTPGYGKLDRLPVAYFVDRDGRVAAVHTGAGSRKQFEESIKALL